MKPICDSEMILNIGPHNPSSFGPVKLVTKLNGETVKSVEPIIGYNHRGVEKLAEALTYIQYLPVVGKIDYICGFIYQEAFCSSVEKLNDISVPKRAQYIRVMLMELTRISSHLFHLGTYMSDLGAKAQLHFALTTRKMISDIFENICGNGVLSDFHIFGGVKQDLDKEILNQIGDFTMEFPKELRQFQDLITDNPVFRLRTGNLGIITKNKALSYGLTGPNLRSSGIKLDARKTKPYLVYDEIEFQIPIDCSGDCYSRCLLRIREMIESLKIIKQCNRFLIKTSGEYKNNLVNPLQIHPEPNTVISHVESPRGIVSCTVISDGSEKPTRVKWRTPSFYAVQILPDLLINRCYSDISTICGSLDISTTEADR